MTNQATKKVTAAPDIIDAIMAYEDGQLDKEETIALFQQLVDSGMAWQLQGSYGRMAKQLIDAGVVTVNR